MSGLKEPSTSHPRIDMCVDCGFCGPGLPVPAYRLHHPRQRIAAARDHSFGARATASRRPETGATFFTELGESTCATDGLRTTRCPLGIDVASFIRDLRHDETSTLTRQTAATVADHFAAATNLGRIVCWARPTWRIWPWARTGWKA